MASAGYEEGQTQLASEGCCRHRLARAERPDEQELAHRRETMGAQPLLPVERPRHGLAYASLADGLHALR